MAGVRLRSYSAHMQHGTPAFLPAHTFEAGDTTRTTRRNSAGPSISLAERHHLRAQQAAAAAEVRRVDGSPMNSAQCIQAAAAAAVAAARRPLPDTAPRSLASLLRRHAQRAAAAAARATIEGGADADAPRRRGPRPRSNSPVSRRRMGQEPQRRRRGSDPTDSRTGEADAARRLQPPGHDATLIAPPQPAAQVAVAAVAAAPLSPPSPPSAAARVGEPRRGEELLCVARSPWRRGVEQRPADGEAAAARGGDVYNGKSTSALWNALCAQIDAAADSDRLQHALDAMRTFLTERGTHLMHVDTKRQCKAKVVATCKQRRAAEPSMWTSRVALALRSVLLML